MGHLVSVFKTWGTNGLSHILYKSLQVYEFSIFLKQHPSSRVPQLDLGKTLCVVDPEIKALSGWWFHPL